MSVIRESSSRAASAIPVQLEPSITTEDTMKSTLMKSMQWSTVFVMVTLAVVVLSCVQSTAASPVHKDWSTHDVAPASEECTGEIQTLCQRCAKSTRSDIVYPMCCANKEDARTWCHSYINFGIHTDTKLD